MQLTINATDKVLAAIAAIGRTEDVQFSPDGRRLAVAGYRDDSVLILEVAIELDPGPGAIELKDHLLLRSPVFKAPHGLSWIDDKTIIVANRDGEVPIVRLPAETPASRTAVVAAARIIKAGDVDLIQTPGSVAVANLGSDLHEVLVCNNYVHYVSRHLIDGRNGFAVVASEAFLRHGLDIPDGVVHSPSGRWIAVSNHNDHSVFIYERSSGLNHMRRADGVLRGICYPHGLHFSPDERFILVADAGAPFIRVFGSASGDWRGDHEPVASLRVIDDESFRRGQTNPQEGGPKGIDIDKTGRILVASCEEQPLVFFDLTDTLAVAAKDMRASASSDLRANIAEDPRDILLRQLACVRDELGTSREGLRNARGELATVRQELGAMQHDLGEARRHLEDAQRSLQETHHDRERAHRDLEAARAHLQGLQHELGELRRLADDYRQRAESSHVQVQELISSTSWRVTAPLRHLKNAVRPPRRGL